MELKSDESKVFSREYFTAVLLAIIVTILWSSSFIIIKLALADETISPLFLAGLRYIIASGLLMALIITNSNHRTAVKNVFRYRYLLFILIVYGLIYYTITMSTQFLALSLIKSITVTLILNLSPIFVLLLAIPLLHESPSRLQLILILLSVIGVVLYFHPISILDEDPLGLLFAFLSMLSNAISAIVGRNIAKKRHSPPIIITGISMAVGSIVLLGGAILMEGFRFNLTPTLLIYILWMSVLNTALAFTLWNKALQSLRAIDSSLINNLMLPEIVMLSLIFLGEYPSFLDWIALIMVVICVTTIQILQVRKKQKKEQITPRL